jgi:hypothetical protein
MASNSGAAETADFKSQLANHLHVSHRFQCPLELWGDLPAEAYKRSKDKDRSATSDDAIWQKASNRLNNLEKVVK